MDAEIGIIGFLISRNADGTFTTLEIRTRRLLPIRMNKEYPVSFGQDNALYQNINAAGRVTTVLINYKTRLKPMSVHSMFFIGNEEEVKIALNCVH